MPTETFPAFDEALSAPPLPKFEEALDKPPSIPPFNGTLEHPPSEDDKRMEEARQEIEAREAKPFEGTPETIGQAVRQGIQGGYEEFAGSAIGKLLSIPQRLFKMLPKVTAQHVQDALDMIRAAETRAGEAESGQMGAEQAEKTAAELEQRASQPPTTTDKAITGTLESGKAAVEGLLEPGSIATLGVASLPSVVGRLVAVGFGADMLSQMPDQVKALKTAVDAGDTKETAKSVSDLVLTGLFASTAIKHGFTPEQKAVADRVAEQVVIGKDFDPQTAHDQLRTIVPTEGGKYAVPIQSTDATDVRQAPANREAVVEELRQPEEPFAAREAQGGTDASLPTWLTDEMGRRGIPTGRIFNDVDLGNPTIRAAIENDPTLNMAQKDSLLKTGALPKKLSNAERRAAEAVALQGEAPQEAGAPSTERQYPEEGMPTGTLSRLQRSRILAGKENVRTGVSNNPPRTVEEWADQILSVDPRTQAQIGLDPRAEARRVTAATVKLYGAFKRGLNNFGEWSSHALSTFGEWIKPKLQSIWDKITSNRWKDELANLDRELFTPDEGQLKSLKEAGNVIGQGETAKKVIGDLIADPAMERVLKLPGVKYASEAVASLDQSSKNYISLKDDPTTPERIRSNVTNEALKDIYAFEDVVTKARLKADGLEALEKKAVEIGERAERKATDRDLSDAVLQAYKRIGREAVNESIRAKREAAEKLVDVAERETAVRQQLSEAQVEQAAFRQALGRSGAVANVLDFIRRQDIKPSDFTTTPELLTAMETRAKNFPDQSFEQTVGADTDTIRTVARVVMASEPLRQTIADLSEISGATEPFRELQRELRKTLKAGDINAALHLMQTGIGKTAAEKALSTKAAKLLLAQEQRLLESIRVLKGSQTALDTIVNSPDYRTIKERVFADAGIRQLVKTATGYDLTVVGTKGEDVHFPIDTAIGPAQEVLQRAAQFKADALDYLAAPDAPGYDVARANGLRFFMEREFDQLFNPGILPSSGRFVPGAATSVVRGIFGLAGNPELIPGWMKQYGAGVLFNDMARTETTWSTADEYVSATFREYRPRLQRAARDAMKNQGIRDATEYHENVLVPILASRQSFKSTPLKVGDEIGNGYTVKGSDAGYINLMLDFEKSVIRKVTATADQNYSALVNSPVGVVFKDGQGRTVYRLPLDTGPSTTGRRLTTAYNWAEQWKSQSGRKQLLENEPRILFGYVADATNPEFTFAYKYREALSEIYGEMKSGRTLEGIDDLVGRLTERVDEARPVIEATVTGELDGLLKRIAKDPDDTTRQKLLIDTTGGISQFNTERGKQVVPSNWFDYGLITTGDFYGFQHMATEPLAIAHYQASRELLQFLGNKVTALERGKETPDFFTLGQAKEGLEVMDSYVSNLGKALKPENIAGRVRETESPSLLRTAFNVGVSSWLGSAKVLFNNTVGGAYKLGTYRMQQRGQGMMYAMLTGHGAILRNTYQHVLYALQHDSNPVTRKIGKAINSYRNTWLIGFVSRHLSDQASIMRELYRETEADGILRDRDHASMLGGTLDMIEGARTIPERRARTAGEAVRRGVSTAGKVFGRAVTRIPIQGADDFINVMAVQEATYQRRDLERRALKYGQVREDRAKATGGDPFDITNPANRFTDNELAGGRWLSQLATRQTDTTAAALAIRTQLRDRVGVDADAAMWDYYRRFKAAEAKEQAEGAKPGTHTANERLLDEAQLRQLRLSAAERINLATKSSRPIGPRTGKVQRNLGMLLSYTGFSLQEFLVGQDRLNTRGAFRGYAWTLPMVAGLLISAGIIGTLELQPGYQAARKLWSNNASTVPTIFTAQTPAQQRDAWLSGAASMIPLFGSMFNLAYGTTSRNGYNFDSQFAVANMASDVMKTVRSAWEMGDATIPAIRFAERNLFPVTFLAQFFPQYSGLKEVGNDQSNLIVASKGTGLEVLVRQPGSNAPRYSEISPFLNAFSNAVGNRDMAGAQAAYQKIVEFKRSQGAADPEKEALQAVQGRNPFARVFATQPTDVQLEQIKANMTPENAAHLAETMQFFDHAVQAVGGNAVNYTKRETVGGRSGGGFGRSTSGRTRRVTRGRRPGRIRRGRVGRTRRSPGFRRRR